MGLILSHGLVYNQIYFIINYPETTERSNGSEFHVNASSRGEAIYGRYAEDLEVASAGSGNERTYPDSDLS